MHSYGSEATDYISEIRIDDWQTMAEIGAQIQDSKGVGVKGRDQ